MDAPRASHGLKVLFLFAILFAVVFIVSRPASAVDAAQKRMFMPLIMRAPPGRVLCENKVYDGYTRKLFVLDSAVDRDPSVQKIIRNCTFRNGNEPPIVLADARNVLIEGSTFENIRTHVAGKGVHAINIACRSACQIDNIVIRNNTFKYIGADGIQLGEEGRTISNVSIQNNVFIGSEAVGENGIDIKGVDGPIYVTGNTFQGFRPCEAPKTGGSQDCTGSTGPGMVIHDGDPSGIPNGVTVTLNRFLDNTYGLVVSNGARNIVVSQNEFSNNLTVGLFLKDVYSIQVTGNSFNNNPVHVDLVGTPTLGGACVVTGNTFSGVGKNLRYKNSSCSS
ncbi:MAG TPA: right-handed parallel beta-helix repeat-containing protein [Anaerolineae bacterium]|nr:right-handed parallel beta-helix repeat-containing protein [Anaerolineae bacterium]